MISTCARLSKNLPLRWRRCLTECGLLCQSLFNRGDDFLAFRRLLRLEAGDRLSVLADEEFAEIPFHIAGENAVLTGERGIKRLLFGALHMDLFHQRKTHRIIGFAEFLDLFRRAGFLTVEIIAGKTDDGESLRRELLL